MAYLDEHAILHLMGCDVDVLLSHQGPSHLQGQVGSTALDLLLDATAAKLWFHGHSITAPDPTYLGPDRECLVIPLDDIAFPKGGDPAATPGEGGWAAVRLTTDRLNVRTEPPACLRDFRRKKWLMTEDGRMIAPPLAAWARAREGIHE